jgi:hypothetical protein
MHLITDDPMQARLWKFTSAMAFVVLQFGKGLNEGRLEVGTGQALCRVVDDAPAVEQRTGLGIAQVEQTVSSAIRDRR